MAFPLSIPPEAKYGFAMNVETQEEADAWLELCVEHTMAMGGPATTREWAEDMERKNIGYWAGYYSHEVRERVERLFRCEHPVFGSIAKNGPPTAEQALAAGIRAAKLLEGK